MGVRLFSHLKLFVLSCVVQTLSQLFFFGFTTKQRGYFFFADTYCQTTFDNRVRVHLRVD